MDYENIMQLIINTLSHLMMQLFQRWCTIRARVVAKRLRHRRFQVLHKLRQQEGPRISEFRYLIQTFFNI